MNVPTNYLYADGVEFSTPQFAPSDSNGNGNSNSSMLSRLQNIPEMSLDGAPSGDVKPQDGKQLGDNTNSFGFFNIPDFGGTKEDHNVSTFFNS